MQELDDLLSFLVKNVDGTLFTAIGGMDGLMIEQYPRDPNDLSAFTAEFTNVLSALGKLVQTEVAGGELQEVMTTAEKVMYYARVLDSQLFLVLAMNPSGNFGKARLYSEQITPKILGLLS